MLCGPPYCAAGVLQCQRGATETGERDPLPAASHFPRSGGPFCIRHEGSLVRQREEDQVLFSIWSPAELEYPLCVCWEWVGVGWWTCGRVVVGDFIEMSPPIDGILLVVVLV